MRVYVGSTGKIDFIKKLQANDVGRVNGPDNIFTSWRGEKWFADNGAYSHWLKGEQFNEDRFWKYLEKLEKFHTPPQFAVLPDIVAEGERSLDFSLSWLDRNLPEWPWFLAVQDGMDFTVIEEQLPELDGLFLGGTLKFKGMTAQAWVRTAKGKPVHFGRAGVHDRLQFAYKAGCDSCDSAFPLWTQDRFDRFMGWIVQGHYDPDSYKQMELA
jgi:hypothetical protein